MHFSYRATTDTSTSTACLTNAFRIRRRLSDGKRWIWTTGGCLKVVTKSIFIDFTMEPSNRVIYKYAIASVLISIHLGNVVVVTVIVVLGDVLLKRDMNNSFG